MIFCMLTWVFLSEFCVVWSVMLRKWVDESLLNQCLELTGKFEVEPKAWLCIRAIRTSRNLILELLYIHSWILSIPKNPRIIYAKLEFEITTIWVYMNLIFFIMIHLCWNSVAATFVMLKWRLVTCDLLCILKCDVILICID